LAPTFMAVNRVNSRKLYIFFIFENMTLLHLVQWFSDVPFLRKFFLFVPVCASDLIRQ
jgi:hypothetical protein